MTYFLGVLSGLVVGNLSLGIFTASLTVLLIGLNSVGIFITVVTTLLVKLTGNINFELIFILVFTLAHLIKRVDNEKLNNRYLYLITGGLLLILAPVFREIFGFIPAQILNEINISGEIILLSGIFLSVMRIILAIRDKQVDQTLVFLISFIISISGIKGSTVFIYIWFIGLIALTIIKYGGFLVKFSKNIKKSGASLAQNNIFLYTIFIALTWSGIYLLLPFKEMIFFIGIIVLMYFNLRPESWQKYRLDIVYFSLLLGLLAARTGFLS